MNSVTELFGSYTMRTVLSGSVLLGVSAAVVGTFMMLRKRSLIGDVVGHAAVPGLAIAYLIGEWRQPGGGQHLPGLIAGAFAAGVAGAVCVLLIDRTTRLRSDAALAVVLAVFYGVGVSLLRIAAIGERHRQSRERREQRAIARRRRCGLRDRLLAADHMRRALRRNGGR